MGRAFFSSGFGEGEGVEGLGGDVLEGLSTVDNLILTGIVFFTSSLGGVALEGSDAFSTEAATALAGTGVLGDEGGGLEGDV